MASPNAQLQDWRVQKSESVCSLTGYIALGSGRYAPPALNVYGSLPVVVRRARQLGSQGLTFSLSAEDPAFPWHPLNITKMQLDRLYGNMTIAANGDFTASVLGAGNMAVGAMSLGWEATASLAGSAESVSELTVSAVGQINIGGRDSFRANVSGIFDQAKGSTVMTMSHEGGWSPINGSLRPYFATPAFDGQLSIGGDVDIAVQAEVGFTSEIALVHDVIVFLSAQERMNAKGPHIRLNGWGGEAGFEYVVRFDAGLQLGSNSSGIPLLEVSGTLNSSGTSMCVQPTDKAFFPVSFQTY